MHLGSEDYLPHRLFSCTTTRGVLLFFKYAKTNLTLHNNLDAHRNDDGVIRTSPVR